MDSPSENVNRYLMSLEILFVGRRRTNFPLNSVLPGVKPAFVAEDEECLGEQYKEEKAAKQKRRERKIEEVGNKTATKAIETAKES